MKKRLLGILLSFAMVLTMMPVLGLTQTAHAADPVEWGADTSFDSDASFEDGVNVTADITITIAEGKTVTVKNGINAGGKTLTVEGKGNLIVNGYNSNDGSGGSAFTGRIIVKDGKVTLTGGAGNPDGPNDKGGNGIEGNVEVRGGSFSATGGNGYTVGRAVSNTITCENGIVAQESANGSEWSDISDDRSNKQYVRTIQTYPLWVGGTQVTSLNKDNVLPEGDNDGKVSFTPATGSTPAKLTLNGANITTGYDTDDHGDVCGIFYQGEEPLIIESPSGSDNKIIRAGTDPFITGIRAANADITLSGGGNLTAEGNMEGILADSITIDGSNVTAVSDELAAISSWTDMVINSGEVTATGGNAGIYSENGSVIINGGNVTASGELQAIGGTVKNHIKGTGWKDTAGTQGKADIAINSEGQKLETYKKVQFPAVPEPVKVSTITYDLNGGTWDGKTGIVTQTVNNGTVITLPAPTRDGYTFDYWEGSKYYAGDKYKVNGDHTFKAVWKTADKGGGSDSDNKGGSSKKGVKTGDEQNVAGWITMMIASVLALAALAVKRKDILHR